MAAPSATSADVAAILLERVGDPGGDFSVSTHPTQAQVNVLIAQIVQEVQAVVGVDVDASLAAYATLVVATGVAAQIELAFSTDLDQADNKYRELHERYIGDKPNVVGGMLAILDAAQEAILAGGVAGDEALPPWASFPDLADSRQTGPMGYTTWGERW